ncbi:hypothetical protein, partial [Acinetobacter sp. YH01024]|uniref:hypothetical protein n=1 Tax=Acinetobacter sp. YH01024 TaxID=2601037 RepID=UPI001C552EF1
MPVLLQELCSRQFWISRNNISCLNYGKGYACARLGFHEALLRASFTPRAMLAAVLDFKKQHFLPKLRQRLCLRQTGVSRSTASCQFYAN